MGGSDCERGCQCGTREWTAQQRKSSRLNRESPHEAASDSSELEAAGRCSALVERGRADRDVRCGNDDGDPLRRCGKRHRQRCRKQRRATRQQLAFEAGIAGRPLERRVLCALDLRAEMVELVTNAFLLHEQQEKRQQRHQDDAVAWNAAKHDAKVNWRACAWQIGRMVEWLAARKRKPHEAPRGATTDSPFSTIVRISASELLRLVFGDGV